MRHARRPRALAAEIFLHPWMLAGEHGGHRCPRRSPCRPTVPRCGRRSHAGCRDRASPCRRSDPASAATCGSVRRNRRRRSGSRPEVGSSRNTISGSSASARAERDALDHAAGQFGRNTCRARPACRPTISSLAMAISSISRGESSKIFAHRELDVLDAGQRGKQRALLEQHAPAALDRVALLLARLVEIDAEHLDGAGHLRQQADDGAHQHGLALPRAADEAQHLAALHVERQPVEDGCVR